MQQAQEKERRSAREEKERQEQISQNIRAPDKFKPFKPYLKTIQILADNLG